jgi:Xaa-Pro aminopeptidase
MIGEFWVGKRPSLADVEAQLGIKTKDLAKLAKFKKENPKALTLSSPALVEAVSTMRFVKDAYEIAEMRKAVNATISGFGDVARSLPIASRKKRGERVVEGAFFARARLEGYDLGYETIAASGANACTLHWTRNDGEVKDGDLILVDAGVEMDSLYTADVTRTIPVNGKFTDAQKVVYEAVLEAADAAFAIAKPGIKFRELHNAAMQVIARRVSEMGLIPVSAEEALDPERQHHRRYMVHGTSHHLGLDVHDCAQAKRELYQDGILEPGMIFTIEPGLYFHKDDLKVPAELRGIGVRIEDDVLVTETGVENLSAALPRTVAGIESWYSEQLLGSAG